MAPPQDAGPLSASADVFITRVKPGEQEAVMAEIAAIDTPHRIRPLVAGQRMESLSPIRDDPPGC